MQIHVYPYPISVIRFRCRLCNECFYMQRQGRVISLLTVFIVNTHCCRNNEELVHEIFVLIYFTLNQ